MTTEIKIANQICTAGHEARKEFYPPDSTLRCLTCSAASCQHDAVQPHVCIQLSGPDSQHATDACNDALNVRTPNQYTYATSSPTHGRRSLSAPVTASATGRYTFTKPARLPTFPQVAEKDVSSLRCVR
eukprot:6206928-Pleurochrysis_carterae.AAC.3